MGVFYQLRSTVSLGKVDIREVAAGTVYGAGEAHTHVDAHARAFHYAVKGRFVAGEGEVGEEAEGAERKGEDRRNDALEKPGSIEYSAIAAEGEN